jgi:Trk K+ transport system NAD-binding subunit
MGERLAKKLTVNSVLDYINLSNDIEILECSFRKPYRHFGSGIKYPQKYSLSIIAIQNGSETMTNIDPKYRFLEGISGADRKIR